MLFNLRLVVLYGLLTVATTTPIFNVAENVTTRQLEARMTKKKGVSQSFTSLEGAMITKEQIAAALGQLRHHKTAGTNREDYPHEFENKVSRGGLWKKVFTEREMGKGSGLLEYPIDIGKGFPGPARVVATAGTTPNFVGVMEHPEGFSSRFKRLSEAKECEAESSKPKNAARDLWEFVKRKVTGKKAKPAKGKACALKPKPKPKTPAKAHTKRPTKKPGKKHTKKPAKKPAKKHTKKPGKKPARKHTKRPAKRPTHASRKGGRRGGRRGGRGGLKGSRS